MKKIIELFLILFHEDYLWTIYPPDIRSEYKKNYEESHFLHRILRNGNYQPGEIGFSVSKHFIFSKEFYFFIKNKPTFILYIEYKTNKVKYEIVTSATKRVY